MGDGDGVRQKDFLVCLCCSFASLSAIILSDDGVILPGQYGHKQYCYHHPFRPPAALLQRYIMARESYVLTFRKCRKCPTT
jgi:hypothetical protein